MESVDNLDRALSTVSAEQLSPSSEKDSSDERNSSDENKALVNLYQGLTMTEKILMQTLKKHGLERFDPSEDGARFDPRLHEATFQTKAEGKEDGEVVMVQQKGFTLNGRVLRVRSPRFLPHDFAKKLQYGEKVLSQRSSPFLSNFEFWGKFTDMKKLTGGQSRGCEELKIRIPYTFR